MGRIGGRRRTESLSPTERSDAARLAVLERWARVRAADVAPVDAERKARLHRTLDHVLDILEGKREPTADELAQLRDFRRILARVAAKGKR